jgi:pimeloyl-ACP methyl ester carboxylesterase
MAAYVPRRISRSRFIEARGLTLHLREWGSGDAPTLVLLHGAQDTSASFQFLVDAFESEWHVLAPDWRGHGLSSWTPGNYSMADFLCDLETVVLEAAPSGPLDIVAHSLGGLIASIYAGVRPSRVRRLVTLDSLGPAPERLPVHMPAMLRGLLDSLGATPTRRIYGSHEEMALRLRRRNPRVDEVGSQFLAQVNAQPVGNGFVWPHDPAFVRSWPALHTLEEWGECWRRIEAPVMCLLASEPRPKSTTADSAVMRERARFFSALTLRTIAGAGHNLHHDAPVAVAQAVEGFLGQEER